MTSNIRLLLGFEAATFAIAALIHAGALLDGYEHSEARIAESVIALVLLAGLALSLLRQEWTREAGMAAQGLALMGTLVGIFTIIVGVGPRSVLDVVYHIAIVVVLIWGLSLALRMPDESAGSRA